MIQAPTMRSPYRDRVLQSTAMVVHVPNIMGHFHVAHQGWQEVLGMHLHCTVMDFLSPNVAAIIYNNLPDDAAFVKGAIRGAHITMANWGIILNKRGRAFRLESATFHGLVLAIDSLPRMALMGIDEMTLDLSKTSFLLPEIAVAIVTNIELMHSLKTMRLTGLDDLLLLDGLLEGLQQRRRQQLHAPTPTPLLSDVRRLEILTNFKPNEWLQGHNREPMLKVSQRMASVLGMLRRVHTITLPFAMLSAPAATKALCQMDALTSVVIYDAFGSDQGFLSNADRHKDIGGELLELIKRRKITSWVFLGDRNAATLASAPGMINMDLVLSPSGVNFVKQLCENGSTKMRLLVSVAHFCALGDIIHKSGVTHIDIEMPVRRPIHLLTEDDVSMFVDELQVHNRHIYGVAGNLTFTPWDYTTYTRKNSEYLRELVDAAVQAASATIFSSPSLKHLILWSPDVSFLGSIHSTSIQTLIINFWSPGDMEGIARCLGDFPNLRELHIINAKSNGESGIGHLLHAAGAYPNLQTLNLQRSLHPYSHDSSVRSYCNIIDAFIKVLHQKNDHDRYIFFPRLKHLDLSHNPDIFASTAWFPDMLNACSNRSIVLRIDTHADLEEIVECDQGRYRLSDFRVVLIDTKSKAADKA